MTTFKGIYPALVTPSDAAGGVSVPALEALVDYLLAKNIDGLYIGGTTGEGIYMSVPDRQLLAEVVLKRVNGRIPVIVHVAAVAFADAQVLARHAAAHGAQGFASIMPPMYNSAASVIAYYQALAASVPELPFFSYILNPHIDPVTVMRALQQSVPNLIGAKYTGPNMYEMRQIMDLNDGKWVVFAGMDEQCVYGAMMGVDGAIGSTLNFMPGAYRAIQQAVARGDMSAAQSMQLRANRVTAAMIEVGFNGALREVLRLIGIECGDPRLPGLPLSADAKAALRRNLEATDFTELVAL
ncbi:MAG TPA: dihydrodipicolinate synthase family protein [Aggregatilineales bacterium]|nr:dihydrodipicolinate synthase family protein [Aggregatilineales bacterium]